MRTRRSKFLAGLLLSTAFIASCSGTTHGSQDDAEQAVVNFFEGGFAGEVDAVINFASDDCFVDFDRSQARAEAKALFADLGLPVSGLDGVKIMASAEQFSDTEATVRVTISSPTGVSVDDLVPVKFENGHWVSTVCDDFEDFAPQPSAKSQLDALGYAGTADDPIPLGVSAPIGYGMEISLNTAESRTPTFHDPFDDPFAGGVWPCSAAFGATFSFRNLGQTEPLSPGFWTITAVDRQTQDTFEGYPCNPTEDINRDTQVFVGGMTTGAVWFDVPNPSTFDGQFHIESVVDDTSLFFDPMTTADSIPPNPTVRGANPNATLFAERNDPTPIGTVTDLGHNWEVVIVSANLDAYDTRTGPDYPSPPEGYTHIQVVAEVTYRSDRDPNLLPHPRSYGFTDANVSVTGCRSDGFVTNKLIEVATYRSVIPYEPVTVTACYTVPDEDVDSFAIYADGQHPYFLAIK